MTGLDLDALERIAAAATPGPWVYSTETYTYRENPCMVWGDRGPGYGAIADTCQAGFDPDRKQANAAFIAASREAVPALIARLRAAEADNARLREALTRMRKRIDAYCEQGHGGALSTLDDIAVMTTAALSQGPSP